MCRYASYTNTSSQTLLVSEEHSRYGSSRLGMDQRRDTLFLGGAYNPTWYGTSSARRELGNKHYELSKHLGNVLLSITDKKAYKTLSGSLYFEAEISTISDYYPFGSAMQTRAYSAVGYRWGFNGKEKDDDINNNCYDYGFRIYNNQIGRFLSVDPLTSSYPWYTPFQFAGNKPLHCIDLDGMEEYNVVSWYNAQANVWQSKLSLIKVDGPLTVNYFVRTWNDGIVPRNSLLASSGYSDVRQGTSTATDPWKTPQEKVHGANIIAANTPPNGFLGDGINDNQQFTEGSDPTVIPIPPVIIAVIPNPNPPVRLMNTVSTIHFVGSDNKFEAEIEAKAEIRRIAKDYLNNGVGTITIKGNIYAPNQTMAHAAGSDAQANGFTTNGDLAKARANAIKVELVKQGVPTNRIKVELGDTKSRTANYTYKKRF